MYNRPLKPIVFEGRSLEAIRAFPSPARQETGYQLDRVQRGFDPSDWKPMSSIGSGVREIRVQYEAQYRVIYIAKLKDAVHVLPAFQKKSQKTSERDLETARRALRDISARREA
jgi:phage-related protein